jgi:hypothetical protein
LKDYEAIEATVVAQLEALSQVADDVRGGRIKAQAANAYTQITKEQRQLLKVWACAKREKLIHRILVELLKEKGLTEGAALRIVEKMYEGKVVPEGEED